ncbi:MAG: septum formation initiator family protein [Candidatus Cloacimonadaceae bacterium]|jgi:cell division protein FtsB|nr:septum formation initiator family protein [Candidatus Cloacimonadota bacterium]MDX9950161.1 septum formation initiator family protein [Candidatus Syntrophosphaera sp.]NLN85350.1 hypothetical protein [Candidatus Cloacimonadota bacterium]
MKTQKPKNKILINIVYLLLFLLVISWILVWGNNSYLKKWQLSQKNKTKETEHNLLSAQNDSLKQEIHRLRTDPEERKLYLKERTGIYEKDETVYIFKPAQEDSLKKTKKGK